MTNTNLKSHITNGNLDPKFTELYGADNVLASRDRYINAIDKFTELFGERDNLALYSAPGRTEIGGNHTDHNLGKVLAASINLDVIAIVSQTDTNTITVKSEGHSKNVVDISNLSANASEFGNSTALIRGIAAKFAETGKSIGGLDAYTTSNVLKGSGLSSSAAFSVLIGTILSGEFNQMTVNPVEIAQIAQYAENVYFGKPCGLMDQTASSVGGIISIDFADNANPIIKKINVDFAKSGYALCIVDTGGSHADLTDEYASIPTEMKSIAAHFGKEVMRQVTRGQVLANAKQLREQFGDRAVMRALHYLDENQRVDNQQSALESGDFDEFKRQIIKSGNSSYKYLQNIYTNKDVAAQGLSLALYLAESLLEDCGAYRVHGGGFGGTTQNFVPLELTAKFKQEMESVFGVDSCHILQIRNIGGAKIV